MPPIDAEPSVVIEVRHLVGDLAAHQQRRDAGGDLHHRQRHDEGGDADHREPERIDEAEQGAERQRQQDRGPAGHRHVGDVHVGFLQREIGDRDAGDVGDAGDRQVDLGAEDHEGEADGDDAGHRHLGQDVAEIVERRKGGAGGGEEAGEADQRQERRDVAHLRAQERARCLRGRLRSAADCRAVTGRHVVSPSRRFQQAVLADRLVANSRTTAPRLSTMMRSASDSTVSGSVDSTMTASPLARRSRTMLMTSFLAPTSMPRVGSHSTSRRGG